MSLNQNHEDTTSSNVGPLDVIANAMKKQLPSSQEEQGEDKLNHARDLVTSDEVQGVEELETDIRVIEEKIIS
jgi:hypothetical protein